jgi:hypothetical protein
MVHLKIKNVEYLVYFGSMVTDDTRGACEIKSGITMTKTAVNKKTFSPKLWSNFRE